MVDYFAALINGTPVGRASDYDCPDKKLFSLVGLGRSFLSLAWFTGAQLVIFFIGLKGISIVGQLTEPVSPRF